MPVSRYVDKKPTNFTDKITLEAIVSYFAVIFLSTHLPLVPHICVRESGQH